MNKAVSWVRENHKRHLLIDYLAKILGMELFNFHRHLRALTTTSPMQYQKHLHLHEARRPMLVDNVDAAINAMGRTKNMPISGSTPWFAHFPEAWGQASRPNSIP